MKQLSASERANIIGPYHAPEGLYEYTKTLPFLGTVKSNVTKLTAGQWTEILLTYEVGASGLADGAWIKATFKFYSVSLITRHLLESKEPSDFPELSHTKSTGLGPLPNLRPHKTKLHLSRIHPTRPPPKPNSSNSPISQHPLRPKRPRTPIPKSHHRRYRRRVPQPRR